MFSIAISIQAQNLNVEYFKWTKTYYKDGTSKTMDGKSGQFVTRHKRVCYDSDCEGYSIGNGSLTFKEKKGNTTMYHGPSYYGTDTYYTFFDDKGILNIEDKDGNVYVYKRTTPPSGRKTSSLIASKRNSDGGSSGGGAVYVPPVDMGGNSSGSTSEGSHARQKHPKACRNCAGRGVCVTCGGSGQYLYSIGDNVKKSCPRCHGSGRCNICNGTGTNGYY